MSDRGRCRFRSVKSSQLTYLQSFGSRCTKDQCAACCGDCVVLSRSSYFAGQGANHLESEKGGLQSEWSLLVKCLPRGVACHACSALPHVSCTARSLLAFRALVTPTNSIGHLLQRVLYNDADTPAMHWSPELYLC